MAKKKIEEEFDLEDEILDEEEFEDIDKIEDLDEDDDEILDEEEDETPKKSKKASKKEKAPKKKMSGKKKAIIAVSVIAGVVLLAVLGVFVIWPALTPQAVIATNTSGVLAKSGYQKYIEDTSTIKLSANATEDHIVSVQEMLDATGLSLSKSSDTTKIAANIFNLAVTNYANVANTAWYCYTDSSVYATNVKAKILFFNLSPPEFKVGVRAAYMLASQETNNSKNAGDANSFSSTISGVTVLDVDGIPAEATKALKGMFGYNIQTALYEGTYAYRRGDNGGAQFFGDDTDEGYKYPMGSYNASFPTKLYDEKNEEGAYKQQAFVVKEYNKKEDSVTQKLEYIETPTAPIVKRENAWDPLQKTYSYAYKVNVYGTDYKYYCGNYGTGWAVYDFAEGNLDPETTVTYDKNTHVYEIKMVIKKDKANAACEFAKGSLTKDTKDYITMQNPEYALEENIIQVFDNGLIKSWKRQETVSSEAKAKLVILSGDCFGGGGTTNITQQAYSYLDVDSDPLANAALYWPQLGDSAVVGKYAFDLKSYPTIDKYNPSRNK